MQMEKICKPKKHYQAICIKSHMVTIPQSHDT
jgi:hypothetical protein